MSADGDEHPAIAFIKTLFGYTTENVYVCSLANDKGADGQAPERSISDRDSATLTTFINRWNQDGRGCFGCISTILAGRRRQKPNAVETPAFPSDLDFKSIQEDEQTVDRRLAECHCPPSLVVHSGHGRHPYWILKEALPTQEYLNRIEAVLRQLADVFAGDLQVCQVVALMRLPGTWNTKGGQRWVVTVTPDNGRRYELDELEEWLSWQSPLLKRKVLPKMPEQDPYATIAQQLGFKPSTDVEERLAKMQYQGQGDRAIHATQLAVTSSLVSRGIHIDDVVRTVYSATMAAAGDWGAHWNWTREERKIRGMSASWAGKIEARDDVVHIAQARAARVKPQPAPVEKKDSKKNYVIAAATLKYVREHGEDLLFERGLAWQHAESVWTREVDHRHWLKVQIERTCEVIEMPSNNRLISEVTSLIERTPALQRKNIPWDQHGMVPTKSGLIDPITHELTAARAEHYATWCVDCEYVPDASCPIWLRMLDDAFADRTEEARTAVIATLQEVLGAALLDRKPRGLHKALVLVGGPNCGKSQLLEVNGGLFGDRHIGQPVAAVDGTHGLMPFLYRVPWLLDEAFNQNVWHMSALVKTLITGEEVSINIKHGPVVSRRFTGPIFWGTNHPPQFKESTRAIVDRLVVVACEQQFDEHRPVGAGLEARLARLPGPAALVLNREKPGVLAWALAGLKRALERGHILVAQESAAAGAQIYRDSNLVAGFVEECVDFDVNSRVSLPDFCVAVSCWFAENKGENRSLPSNDSIGRALVALHDPRLVSDRYELRDNSARYLVGAKLNLHGLEYHERGTQADMFEGKTVQTTPGGGLVNKAIPAAWDTKPKVIAMRAAHAAHAEKSQKEVSPAMTQRTVTGNSVTSSVSRPQAPDPSSDPLFK